MVQSPEIEDVCGVDYIFGVKEKPTITRGVRINNVVYLYSVELKEQGEK